jgi:hypothetical protein
VEVQKIDRGRTVDGLTPKQERFAQEVAKGSTLSDAYRAAYDVENSKDNTIHGAASDLMGQGHIAARVRELLKEQERMMLKDAVAIRRHVFNGLMKESEDADSPPAARIRALELLGKIDIVSMFKERTEHVTDERKPEDIEKVLKERLRALLRKG